MSWLTQRTRELTKQARNLGLCVERVTGIEPALSAWEEFLCHRVLQRFWRPHLDPVDP